MWIVELFVIVGMKCFRSIICSSRVGRNFSPHWWWIHCVIIYVCWQHIIGKVLNFVVTWRTYFKSFFSKFSSSILKSSELMIFEGRSDIISTAFLLQAVLKICRSSFCAFVSCIWSNSPLRIILIDSSINTLAEQDLYGASPSNFSIRRPGGISGLLLRIYNDRFPLIRFNFLEWNFRHLCLLKTFLLLNNLFACE